jgi:hypothetical protein
MTLLLLGGVAWSAFVPVPLAQTRSSAPVRVEAREVVIPAFVVDRTNFSGGENIPDCSGCAFLWENDRQITDLSAKDFHIFEDGIEQPIQKVILERRHFWGVQDNVYWHNEYSCTPRGIWACPDLNRIPDLNRVWKDAPECITKSNETALYFYLLYYLPRPSSEGSCHRIKVKVDRHNATVYASDQYCNTKDALSDPLYGTKFGQRMENWAVSPQDGKIPAAVQVGSLFGDAGTGRVDIAVEFRDSMLNREWTGEGQRVNADIGVLGLVYNKDGKLFSRFSDAACEASAKYWNFYRGPLPRPDYLRLPQEITLIPSRYETQIDLPPGDYDLKVVVSDGVKFGRVEMPLTVDSYDRKNLAITGVILCKRFHEAAGAPDEAALRAPKYVPLVSKNVEYTSTADNLFQKGDRLVSYFEIYEPLLEGTGAVKVQFHVRVTDVKTGELKVDTGLRSAESWIRPASPVTRIAQEIAIDKLPAGTYRLEVQASDSAGNRTGWRATSFTVE